LTVAGAALESRYPRGGCAGYVASSSSARALEDSPDGRAYGGWPRCLRGRDRTAKNPLF